MLNLFDYLTEQDNRIINNYITKYGTEEGYIGNETYLKYWAECNKKLFHLLGGELIHKVPFEYEVSKEDIAIGVDKLLEHKFVDLYRDILENNSPFFIDKYSEREYYDLYNLLCKRGLREDKIALSSKAIKIKEDGKKQTFQISDGIKPMRAIQKTINYFSFFTENKELLVLFEDFRQKHSLIFNSKKIKCNMCFSIHPMDFITMSDNANNWHSCMSWKDQGCYHLGTVEMMNSNNVICVYLDSKDLFFFGDAADQPKEDYTWNNKRWRQLFYCTKEIIVSGKAYPYQNEVFTKFALNELRKLAKENWNHTYQFGIEPYRDMIHMGSWYRVENNRGWIKYNRTTKHNIIFDTKSMYNDMLNDSYTTYWCIRNKVKKNTIISYSGKAPCVCCMQPVHRFCDPYMHDEGSYNDRYDNQGAVVCLDCIDKRHCNYCGNNQGVYKTYHFNGKDICSKCWTDEIKVCPDCGCIYMPKFDMDDIIESYQKHIYMCVDKDVNLDDNFYLINFQTYYSTGRSIKFYQYCCCKDCEEKLKANFFDNNDFNIRYVNVDFERYDYLSRFRGNGRYRKMFCFDQIFDKNDEFFKKHNKEGLEGCPPPRD